MCKRAKPLPADPTLSDVRRFWSMVRIDPAGCWLWEGAKDSRGHGYGFLKFMARKVAAYRFLFHVFNGAIPPGMEVHHTCFNTSCVNPLHLSLATRSDNARWKRPAESGAA